MLRERRQVDDPDPLAQHAAFVADVLEIVAAPETPDIAPLHARRREPVGTFPPIALAEDRAHALQPVVDGTRLRGTRILAFLVRVVNREDVAVGFLVLRDDVAAARVGPEAARVDGEHVDARLAFDDPLRELPARTAGGRDAEAVALVEPEVAHFPGRPYQRAAVRRVADRAVDDVLDAAVLERRHAPLRGFDVRQQPLELARKQVFAERLRHAVGESRRRPGLVRPENPAEPLLAQVIGLVGFAQHCELAAATLAVGSEFAGLVVDEVLVLDGDRGHVEAEHAAHLPRVIAGRAHDVLRDDLAATGREPPFAACRRARRRDFGLLVNLGARIAGGPSQRHRKIGGSDVPVVGVIQGADDLRHGPVVAELDQRPQRLDLVGADDLERHADRVRGAAVLAVFVHAVAAGREPQVARHVEADVLARFRRQTLV